MENIALIIPIIGVSIGLVAVIGKFWLEGQKLKLKAAEAQGVANAVFQDHEGEILKLKNRVAVLERLLTDDDRRIADEISRLKGSDAGSRG